MSQGTPLLDYETACFYAGQLFLETRHQSELLTRQLRAQEAQLAQLVKERDEAVAAFALKPKPE